MRFFFARLLFLPSPFLHRFQFSLTRACPQLVVAGLRVRRLQNRKQQWDAGKGKKRTRALKLHMATASARSVNIK
jgi:hypothetical protein